MILTELTIKNNEILYLTSYQSSYFIEAEELHPKRRSCFLLFQTLKVTLTQAMHIIHHKKEESVREAAMFGTQYSSENPVKKKLTIP